MSHGGAPSLRRRSSCELRSVSFARLREIVANCRRSSRRTKAMEGGAGGSLAGACGDGSTVFAGDGIGDSMGIGEVPDSSEAPATPLSSAAAFWTVTGEPSATSLAPGSPPGPSCTGGEVDTSKAVVRGTHETSTMMITTTGVRIETSLRLHTSLSAVQVMQVQMMTAAAQLLHQAPMTTT